ncbi:MAG: cyclopropane-fatty-acyl-phospholipid synthase family protein [Anaerolineae bacterium]|nr:cyclopropane-fatty-acyl-phospholipid synthase family protein [Anaerolineae bacterium]
MTTQARMSDKSAVHSLEILQTLLRDYHPRDFKVCFWDGSEWPAEVAPSRFSLYINHPAALRHMLLARKPDLAAGEAYIYDDIDIQGEIEALFPVADYLMEHKPDLLTQLQLGWKLFKLPRSTQAKSNARQAAQLTGETHSIERDRQAIAYHYDVSNDFYAMWLDERMVYSCAYFATADEALDVAQARKLDYLCRKLRLQPGERLLDIGCGWGGLVLHAAQNYGVEAVGITLSRQQVNLANKRIQEAGLGDRCRVDYLDYRELDPAEPFDKLVSVGMFEHVGEARLREYFQRAWQLLRPGGAFMNHGIGRDANSPLVNASTFIGHYVFPDGELVPINVTLRHAEAASFEVRDVESLREHYALTLRHWVRRLEQRRADILKLVDEATYRTWRLFMAGTAYGFASGRLNLYQTLLVKPDQGRSGLPLMRRDWYDD